MTIKTNMNGTCLEVAVEGRLDTTTAPELEKELARLMPDAESLTLDFSSLAYISSAGLRVLLAAHKTMLRKGGMKVTHVNEIVQEQTEGHLRRIRRLLPGRGSRKEAPKHRQHCRQSDSLFHRFRTPLSASLPP